MVTKPGMGCCFKTMQLQNLDAMQVPQFCASRKITRYARSCSTWYTMTSTLERIVPTSRLADTLSGLV